MSHHFQNKYFFSIKPFLTISLLMIGGPNDNPPFCVALSSAQILPEPRALFHPLGKVESNLHEDRLFY